MGLILLLIFTPITGHLAIMFGKSGQLHEHAVRPLQSVRGMAESAQMPWEFAREAALRR